MTLDRAESILFNRSDSAEPITAQELADRLNCGILVSYRYLIALKKAGVVKSKRVGGENLVWWVPEWIDQPSSSPSLQHIENELKRFCAEADLEYLLKPSIQILEEFVSTEELKDAEQWDRERWIAAAVRIASEKEGEEIKYSRLSEYTEKANSSQIHTRVHSMSRKASER